MLKKMANSSTFFSWTSYLSANGIQFSAVIALTSIIAMVGRRKIEREWGCLFKCESVIAHVHRQTIPNG